MLKSVFIAVLLTTARKWNQPDAHQKVNGLKKHSMCTERILCIRKKPDITTFTGRWLQLEIIMLSEVRQTQKNSTCFLLYQEATLKII